MKVAVAREIICSFQGIREGLKSGHAISRSGALRREDRRHGVLQLCSRACALTGRDETESLLEKGQLENNAQGPHHMQVAMHYILGSGDTSTAGAKERYDGLLREAEWANGCGFTALWLGEHHFSSYGYSSAPTLLLARLAGVAPDIRLGIAVAVLPIWSDPIRLVEEIATLDVLTNGRVDFGLGRGYQEYEYAGYGKTSKAADRERVEEQVQLIRRAFTQVDFTFDGKYFKVLEPITVFPKPIQKPHPPFWMAAVTTESMQYTAREGIRCMLPTRGEPEEVREKINFLASWCKYYGRDFSQQRPTVSRFIFCSNSEDEIEQAIAEIRWQDRVSRATRQGARPVAGDPGVPPPYQGEQEGEAWHRRVLVGSPDKLIPLLKEYADAGVTYLFGGFSPGRLPWQLALKSAQLFAAEVLPVISKFQSPKPVITPVENLELVLPAL